MRNSSRSSVDPFIVMDVMEAARRAEEAGRHIIHMEVGQPGTAAPEGARSALAQAMSRDAMGYTVAIGLPALRARIAPLYREWSDQELSTDRVGVTRGLSGVSPHACTALSCTGRRGWHEGGRGSDAGVA